MFTSLPQATLKVVRFLHVFYLNYSMFFYDLKSFPNIFFKIQSDFHRTQGRTFWSGIFVETILISLWWAFSCWKSFFLYVLGTTIIWTCHGSPTFGRIVMERCKINFLLYKYICFGFYIDALYRVHVSKKPHQNYWNNVLLEMPQHSAEPTSA